MKPHQQLRRVKASERCYHWLIWFYPTPFRAAFGQSMRQVFRDQCIDVVERKGGWGLAALWLRTLLDFAWTCPKEHVVALPTLPRRIWEDALRPSGFYPALIAAVCFLIIVAVTFLQPQHYASTVTLEVRKPKNREFDPYFLQTEFEKIGSKAVLYPVIEALSLQDYYGFRSSAEMTPPYRMSNEEAYRALRGNLRISQVRHTELINVTVFDEERSSAKFIANEIAASYLKWRLDDTIASLSRSQGIAPNQASTTFDVPVPSDGRSQPIQLSDAMLADLRGGKIINPAEEALRPARPNRYLNIFLGGIAALVVGTFTLCILWLIRRLRHRETLPA
jgi:hypothetical protein